MEGSEGKSAPPPPPPHQRPDGLPESLEVKLTKAVIAREEATTRLLDKLTELAEIGRHFLDESAKAELAEQEGERQRREERLARARQR